MKEMNITAGHGFIGLANQGRLNADATGRFVVNTAIIDRLAGISHTEEIYSGVLNTRFVCRLIATRNKREELASFLISYGVARVIEDVVGSKTIRVGGPICKRTELFANIKKHIKTPEVAQAMLEVLMPLMVKNGLTNVKKRVYAKVHYLNAVPKLDQIIDDFQRQVISKAVAESTSLVNLKSGTVYSTSALAEEIATAMFPLGVALLSVKDFDMVARDMGRGVRAILDPALTGLTGDVPEFVREHDAVISLSTNLVFIKYALSIGADGKKDSIRIMSDGHKFEKWAPTVLAMLRTSDRFAIVSKQQYLESIGVKVIKDMKCQPRVALLWEEVHMAPAAMAVIAVPDLTFDGAVSLAPHSDRIAEHIEASFGTVGTRLSTGSLVSVYSDILRDAIETDEKVGNEIGVRYFMHSNGHDLSTIAMMMADSVSFKPGASDYVIYRARSEQKCFEPKSGSYAGGYIMTTDPVEILLALQDREPSKAVDVPPQLIGRSALNSSVIGLEEGQDYIPLSRRFAFSSEIMGVKFQGSLKAYELHSMETPSIVSLIRPDFNYTVASMVFNAISTLYQDVGSIADVNLRARCKRAFTTYIQGICEGVSPAFRQDIHDAIIERSIATLEPEIAARMRATASQKSLGAVTDVIATAFFFIMQGLVGQRKDAEDKAPKERAEEDAAATKEVTTNGTNVVDRHLLLRLLSDEEIVNELTIEGSDRG